MPLELRWVAVGERRIVWIVRIADTHKMGMGFSFIIR